VAILKPKSTDFVNTVNEDASEWSYTEKLLYFPCIKDMAAKKIKDIDESFVKGPIRTFLISWGLMVRVINSKDRKTWRSDLAKSLKKHECNLEKFRKLDLKSVDISAIEDDIKELYSVVRKIVGPTSASKALHLICPKFFPLWDENIRKKCKVNCEKKGYYEFMGKVKLFCNDYAKQLTFLQNKYKKSELRLIDQYMWKVANSK